MHPSVLKNIRKKYIFKNWIEQFLVKKQNKGHHLRLLSLFVWVNTVATLSLCVNNVLQADSAGNEQI